MAPSGGGRGTTRVGDKWYVKGRSKAVPQSAEGPSGAGPSRRAPAELGTPQLTSRLTREDIRSLLAELAERLTTAGIEARVTLLGGAALALGHYDRHGTIDVDALIFPPEEVQRAASEVARSRGLKPDWLSDAAKMFLPVGRVEEPNFVDRNGTLTVDMATPRTLLAMKLLAARPARDKDDVAVLIRTCGICSVEEAAQIVEEFYGVDHELSATGRAIVKEVLGPYEIVTATGGTLALAAVTPPPAPTICGKWVVREDVRCEMPVGHTGSCSARSAKTPKRE